MVLSIEYVKKVNFIVCFPVILQKILRIFTALPERCTAQKYASSVNLQVTKPAFMANKPTPGRKAFKDDLEVIDNDIPYAYSARVLEILKKNGYAVTLGHLLAARGRDFSDKGMMLHINNVRKGATVDWFVLAAFQELVKEVKKSVTQEAVAA
jgi:hypothetical protein